MKTLIIKKILIALIAVGGLTVGLSFILKPEKSYEHLGIVTPTSMDVPYETNQIDAEEEFVYEGQFGTEVKVPANAFVDNEGNPVKGKVDLRVREFHGLKDVFLSGITMQSKEGDEVMQSSGMIEIRAYQNGDTLELASGKELDIKLAATGDPDKEYSLFYLEEDKSWSNPMPFEEVKDDTKQTRLVEIDKLDMTSDSVFEIHTAYEGRPFLQMWKGVKWQLFNCNGELPYTEVNDVIWDYIHVKPLDEQRKLFSIDMVSTMHTYNGSTKQYQTDLVARPILSDKDLAALKRKGEEIESKLSRQVAMLFEKEKRDAQRVEKEMKDWDVAKGDLYKTLEERKMEAIAAYEEQLKREQEEYQKQASRAALFNKFKANQLGIWNIDCFKMLELQEFYCSVSIDGKEVVDDRILPYVLLEDIGSVVRLNRGQMQKLPVADEKCSLIVIFEDGWIGLVDSREYARSIKEGLTDGIVDFKGVKLDNDQLDEKLGEIGQQKLDQWRAKFV